ncbi:MAG: protein-export chaperone SecB [Pseudomonadota bacterium]
MAENGAQDTLTPSDAAAVGGDQPAQQNVNVRALAQYVRDLSFENVLAQKGAQPDVKPEVSVQVALDGRKRGGDNQYETIIKLTVNSKAKDSGEPLFVLELDYAGLFHIEGVPQEQMHPFLLIECPRLLFPYLRRVVSDITRDGGFPPLNLENIDFVGLYRNEIKRRIEAQKASGETTGNA